METASGTILATAFVGHFFYFIMMAVLLCCSAFFSGAETAFFHLSQRTVRQFAASQKRIETLIARTLANPSQFLTALLFGNMLVNVLYFALTSLMSFQFTRSSGPAVGSLAAVGGFMMLLLFGEMLPKSLAYTNARKFCLCAAPACYLILRVLSPLLSAIDTIIVQPAIRLCVSPKSSPDVSINQLKSLLDASRHQGLIGGNENQLLTEVLKFSFLKVRHVMQPRVKMPTCSVRTPVKTVTSQMLDSNLVRMPVYTDSVDSVVGFIHLRDLLLNPTRPLSSMLRQAQFVPEQKSVESLIEFFTQTKTEAAIAVDEYGGVAGWVGMDDITEQLLGPLEDAAPENPIEQIGPMKYRLRADLSIHEWMEAFGIDIRHERQVTIGGFVIALLGRIPKEGDEVVFKNIKFVVEQFRQNRIQTIILILGSLDQPDQDA